MMGNHNSTSGKAGYYQPPTNVVSGNVYPNAGVSQPYIPQAYYPQSYAQPMYMSTSAVPPNAPFDPPPPYTEKPFYQSAAVAPNYVAPPRTTYVVPDAYDAGARFSATSPASVPPPPPGVMPNAAQLAAMQGQNVVLGQRPNNFFTGGSGGGYTFW